jgi:hypothetical protein
MPWVGFELTIRASEREKAVHASDRSATGNSVCARYAVINEQCAFQVHQIWDFHEGCYEVCRLAGCNIVYFWQIPTFWKNTSHPSSKSKNKRSKAPVVRWSQRGACEFTGIENFVRTLPLINSSISYRSSNIYLFYFILFIYYLNYKWVFYPVVVILQ